tara:strand:+ start:998 stop:1600 length:603 start_codon:yes stop_codon:yes gene_type:complete
MFHSDAKQDQFAANMLGFKKDGYYVDIGSCGPIGSNNSYYFESLGWNGICVEIESSYNPQYVQARRTCNYINDNALNLDYRKIFEDNNYPKEIDYLSVDIDELSYDALTKLPHDEYKFKVITIEHDVYLRDPEFKRKQKEFLHGKGYFLICENVYVEQNGYYGKQLPFEDWWIHPEFFEEELINKIKSDNMLPSEIITKF